MKRKITIDAWMEYMSRIKIEKHIAYRLLKFYQKQGLIKILDGKKKDKKSLKK